MVGADDLNLHALGVGRGDIAVMHNAARGRNSNARDQSTQALYVWPNGFNYSFAKHISDLANANRLPSIYPFSEGALAGGLLSYGADVKDNRRTARGIRR